MQGFDITWIVVINNVAVADIKFSDRRHVFIT